MLKLAALDADDLAVISAHLQDAVLLVGDVGFNLAKQQFALIANRFAWDAGGDPGRRRAALHFDRVTAVKSHAIRRGEPDAVLSLLAVTFEETRGPSGTITLTFSGGGAIRLEVECIEASLADLGPAWAASRQPSHEKDGEEV